MGKKKLLMIIGLVALVGGVGFGGYMMGGGGKAKAEGGAEKGVNEEVAEGSHGEAGHGAAKAAEKSDDGHGAAAPSGGDAHGGGPGAAAPVATTKADITYTFDPPFIVNLFDPTARTLLRAAISVEATTPEAFNKIKDNVFPLRDVTVMILTSKTREEVLTPDGKERIKNELKARYEGKLGPKVINEIYLGDFMVNKQ